MREPRTADNPAGFARAEARCIGRRLASLLLVAVSAGCGGGAEDGPIRASGYVEATEVRVAPEVGGRIVDLPVDEGDRVAAGTVIARLDTADTDIALRRAEAERAHAAAQLRLLQAGPRGEEIRQSRAQAASVQAEVTGAESELKSAAADLARFEALLASNAGSRKQRDDAATRRDMAAARLDAARERARAATERLAQVRAGARREEVAAARARVEAADAQIAALRKSQADAVVKAPVAGTITSRLLDVGEIVAPRTPILVLTDLHRAWANVYVDAPVVPRLALGQPIPLVTDDGQRIDGKIAYISPKAEFTPRNVQTADERTRLVYRIKVTTDNRQGILKSGMPVEAEIPR